MTVVMIEISPAPTTDTTNTKKQPAEPDVQPTAGGCPMPHYCNRSGCMGACLNPA